MHAKRKTRFIHPFPSPLRIRTNNGNGPQRRYHPNNGDHDQRPLLGPLAQVLQWGSYGPVPVQREYEQVEDGGGRGGVVNDQPHLTHGNAQDPVGEHDVHGRDGHDYETHDQIGDGQTQYEHVADL